MGIENMWQDKQSIRTSIHIYLYICIALWKLYTAMESEPFYCALNSMHCVPFLINHSCRPLYVTSALKVR